MKIGILETGKPPTELTEDYGDYVDAFKGLLANQGFEFEGWSVVDGVFPASVSDANGWLITGSRHGAYEDHDWIPPLEDFIREAVTLSVPMVGICFGHQIIAQALGGKVEKYAGGWVVGHQVYDFFGTPLAMHAWHQDQVVELPPGATTLASGENCAHAAIIYGDRALTVQAHPEYDAGFIEGLIEHRGKGVVPDAQLQTALDGLGQGTSNQLMADQIADFFRQERAK
ncbi:type 1 glutamine amidotransferase [Shimia abyssi]|uniref:GMP synthase (Glutamine-hydrolysing) n=1 Tax=Shimia abyssi TaxID=1662395 RepID=A0A2P8FJ97_9RHOB|nr:type 1 glutamine amidotransferase [Shimia abyssi]PSL21774.1 GMP synthase (glutamine-hydrolysing) [Shimia abyssi]